MGGAGACSRGYDLEKELGGEKEFHWFFLLLSWSNSHAGLPLVIGPGDPQLPIMLQLLRMNLWGVLQFVRKEEFLQEIKTSNSP